MPLAAGSRLGPYEIQSALGAGGMGEVYKARDTRLGRTVAIKVLPENFASDPDFRERFEREAKVISSLDHPRICALYDVGEVPNPVLRQAQDALSPSKGESRVPPPLMEPGERVAQETWGRPELRGFRRLRCFPYPVLGNRQGG
jgi:serine/threonine protein kinase